MARVSHGWPIALSLGALCSVGCFFDRSGMQIAGDGGRLDAGVRDGGVRIDAGPPDAGPPDTGPASCDSQYGTANGYVLCEERATECEFVTTLLGARSCESTCAALGGRCITAYANELCCPVCERQGAPIPCNTVHQDDICICSRGP